MSGSVARSLPDAAPGYPRPSFWRSRNAGRAGRRTLRHLQRVGGVALWVWRWPFRSGHLMCMGGSRIPIFWPTAAGERQMPVPPDEWQGQVWKWTEQPQPHLLVLLHGLWSVKVGRSCSLLQVLSSRMVGTLVRFLRVVLRVLSVYPGEMRELCARVLLALVCGRS
jgi:hypothetical protein